LRLQFGLDRSQRHLVFELVVVHVAFGRGLGGILLLGLGVSAGGRRTERGRRWRRRGRRHSRRDGGSRLAICLGRGRAVGGRRDQRGVHAALGVGAGVGRFEIDDVAKEDLSFV